MENLDKENEAQHLPPLVTSPLKYPMSKPPLPSSPALSSSPEKTGSSADRARRSEELTRVSFDTHAALEDLHMMSSPIKRLKPAFREHQFASGHTGFSSAQIMGVDITKESPITRRIRDQIMGGQTQVDMARVKLSYKNLFQSISGLSAAPRKILATKPSSFSHLNNGNKNVSKEADDEAQAFEKETSIAPRLNMPTENLGNLYSKQDIPLAKNAAANTKYREGNAGLYVVGSAESSQLPIHCERANIPGALSAKSFTRIHHLPDEIDSVVLGSRHGIVISKGGKEIYSFGNNLMGALGRKGEENIPRLVDGLDSLLIKQVVCGDHITAFLTSKGQVYACGAFKNSEGVVQFDEENECMIRPTHLARFKTPIIHMASSRNSLLVVTKNGDLYRLGFEPSTITTIRQERQKTTRMTRLACNSFIPQSIGVKEFIKREGGKKSHAVVRFQKVFAGAEQFFAIDTHDRVWAFGSNSWGELGLGDTQHRAFPSLVRGLTNHQIISIASGTNHTLFLTKTGIVYACGRNDCCQLGFGAHLSPTFPSPTRVTALEDITSIGSGSYHSVAVNSGGKLYTWGKGEDFALGNLKRDVEKIPTAYRWIVRKEVQSPEIPQYHLDTTVSSPMKMASLSITDLPSSEMDTSVMADITSINKVNQARRSTGHPVKVKKVEFVQGLYCSSIAATSNVTFMVAKSVKK